VNYVVVHATADTLTVRRERLGLVPALIAVFLAVLMIAALSMMSGCATTVIDEHRGAPADWPELDVRIHKVNGHFIFSKCYPHMPGWAIARGALPVACAEVNFCGMICNVYVHEVDMAELDHELKHCRGMDHVGETGLRDLWARFRDADPKTRCGWRQP
jgi:hypothetical protein